MSKKKLQSSKSYELKERKKILVLVPNLLIEIDGSRRGFDPDQRISGDRLNSRCRISRGRVSSG